MNAKTAQVNLYVEAGFTLARNKNHQVWRCPCGHTQLIDSGSRADYKGPTNGRLRIKRTLRTCTINLAAKEAEETA